MKVLWRFLVALTVLLPLAVPHAAGAQTAGMDFSIPGGWYYKQANGQGGQGDSGYSITDADSIFFYREFKAYGGVDVLGYPATRRFTLQGFTIQGTQKVGMQWRPELGTINFLNIFDLLHDQGMDAWLQSVRMVPAPFDTAPDTGLGFE